MRELVNHIFLIHLVITQGDNSDKTRKFDQIRLKLKAQDTLQCKRVSYRPNQIKLIKCRLILKTQEILYKRVSYRPQSPTSDSNECLCVRLQIDQMSIIN